MEAGSTMNGVVADFLGVYCDAEAGPLRRAEEQIRWRQRLGQEKTATAIKFVVGGEPLCGRGLSCAPASPVAASAGQTSVGPASRASRDGTGEPAAPSHGADAVLDLIGGLLQ